MTSVEGYRAAEIRVAQALDAAQLRKPRRFRARMRKLAAYRQGYYEGLLFAHWQLLLGGFPERNEREIRDILGSLNKGSAGGS